MEEIWKSVPGWEHRLEVSSYGNVRTVGFWARSTNPKKPDQFKKPRVLSPWVHGSGYYSVVVQSGSSRKTLFVHRLVGFAFLYGHFPNATIDHINANRLDNRVENLEWVTRSENTRRQCADGRGLPRGIKHPLAKLNDDQVASIPIRRASGETVKDIAKSYNVCAGLIYSVLSGQRKPSYA